MGVALARNSRSHIKTSFGEKRPVRAFESKCSLGPIGG